ncbi:hypothetical protein Tco_0432517 [Tanacetum coccineum]
MTLQATFYDYRNFDHGSNALASAVSIECMLKKALVTSVTVFGITTLLLSVTSLSNRLLAADITTNVLAVKMEVLYPNEKCDPGIGRKRKIEDFIESRQKDYQGIS